MDVNTFEAIDLCRFAVELLAAFATFSFPGPSRNRFGFGFGFGFNFGPPVYTLASHA